MTNTKEKDPLLEVLEETKELCIEPVIPKSSHYINNKDFLQALIEYRQAIDDAVAQGKEIPRVTNYIGECFIKIATHLSYKSNFINYSFRDDMISDGIENCLTAATKFDPTKGSNPFAYYTQIIFFAFIRRIQKEKKQQATKYKLMENMDLDSIIANAGDSETGRQLVDYIKMQLDGIDPDKKLVPSELKAKKARQAKLDEEMLDNTDGSILE
jgi:DNA-directed RNA polymerase specialized sigma subunit